MSKVMKTLFLDFDGILNSSDFLVEKNLKEEPFMETIDWWGRMVNPENVKCLNKIIIETGAKVVISSTWRRGVSNENLLKILLKKGLTPKTEIIGRTTTSNDEKTRGERISEWVTLHSEEIESFVVLDDEGGEWMDPIRDRLVQANPAVGLTIEDAEKAIEMLGEIE